jgi:hypothetical protein
MPSTARKNPPLTTRVGSPRAAQPSAPARQFSFTGFQTSNPTAPPPGDKLDGEYDRTNAAVGNTQSWVATSLNTDGSLRAATVGQSQLVPGLFDFIAADAVAEVQPLVNQATAAAGQAVSSASAAANSATSAASQNTAAQGAAATASTQASNATTQASLALTRANTAQTAATNASNAANSADGDAALCTDYGLVTQAWAEHMPDTIPPNILAVMGVTGDHWSSRWWANQAAIEVENATAEAICDLQAYWLGAYANPPTTNSCGEPVAAGAMYFNTTSLVTQVYDGVTWHNLTQMAPGQPNEYLYLPATPTTVFSGTDYHGNVLSLDTVNSEVGVYLNGVRLLKGIDYSITSTAVTMLLGPITTPNTVEVISLKDVTHQPPPSGVKVNTTPWAFNGITKTFPLATSTGTTINPPGSVDCIVSLNGVIQEPGGDFTTRPGFIDFIVAPETDADRWMVVGLPLGAGLTLAAAEAGPRGQRGHVGRAGPPGPRGPRAGDLAARVEELELQVEDLEQQFEVVNARLAVLERRL